MVTTLASDHVCYNSIVRQWVFVNAYGRATCICVAWSKRTIKPESQGPYLNGLEKFIFPMYFLKADDIVVVGTSSEIIMFQFPRDV